MTLKFRSCVALYKACHEGLHVGWSVHQTAFAMHGPCRSLVEVEREQHSPRMAHLGFNEKGL